LQDRARVSEVLRDRTPLSAEQLKDICVEMEDFVDAMKRVQPSAKREGCAERAALRCAITKH